MISFYKTFSCEYNKAELLELYNTLKQQDKCTRMMTYDLADLTGVSLDKFPLVRLFSKEPKIAEYGLSELVKETPYHINPGNNGLLVFPLSGSLFFESKDYGSIEVTEPTAINGKLFHKYSPKESPAIFFAVKIPSNVSWNEVCKMV